MNANTLRNVRIESLSHFQSKQTEDSSEDVVLHYDDDENKDNGKEDKENEGGTKWNVVAKVILSAVDTLFVPEN